MNALKELQKISRSLKNIEFDQYCKQCGERSLACQCKMGGLKWVAYNKDMRAFPVANQPLKPTGKVSVEL